MSLPVPVVGRAIGLETKLKQCKFNHGETKCVGEELCVFAQQITHHLRCLQRQGRTLHPQLHPPTHRWQQQRPPPHSHHLHQQPRPCPLQTILLNLKSVSITLSTPSHTHAATAAAPTRKPALLLRPNGTGGRPQLRTAPCRAVERVLAAHGLRACVGGRAAA